MRMRHAHPDIRSHRSLSATLESLPATLAWTAALALVPLASVLPAPSDAEAQRVPADGPEEAVQPVDYFFPEGTTFDEAIPSPEEFLGYEIGSHHTRHDRIVAYMEELASLSDRATFQSLGRSIEHRELPVLTVTSPENHDRLDGIRQEHVAAVEAAGDPEAGDPEADDPDAGDPEGGDPADAADAPPDSERPVIVHLGYGVHGNEISSSEAAMLTAYWLVAGEGADVAEYLDEGVFHIEPVLNPDGRDRHTNWANMHKADPYVADPRDREHNEVWPGGRTNHYWFDLNRDWLPLTDPSSRARVDFHHQWMPNVVTDYHEMGTNTTYFFEPTEPEGTWNPLLPEELYTDVTLRFAERWSETLDDIGTTYFTREVFDNSYPGYGSTYPGFLGGLGLVFEQASARGHIQESSHHGVLTFAYGIRNQLRTSIATVQAAVEEKERMHEYQRDFFAGSIEEAQEDAVTGWVFGSDTDPSINREFLDLLLEHELEVYELEGTLEVDGETFHGAGGGRPHGETAAWVVPAEQPGYRLARSMFERVETFADSVFYDASAWTMSLAYGIPDGEITGPAPPMGDPVTEVPEPLGTDQVPEASVAYLLDWSDHYAPRALQYLLARGVRTEVALEPFTLSVEGGPEGEGERSFPRGSITVPVQVQDLEADEVHRLVEEASQNAGVPIHATHTSYTRGEGVDLGSGNVQPLDGMPRALMVVGSGVSQYEAGQAWHLLDTRVDLPITKVDRNNLGQVDFGDYDVVVLVSGNYGFMEDRVEDLQRFVQGGGTLVALRNAAQWAIGHDFAPRVSEAVEEMEEAGEGPGMPPAGDAPDAPEADAPADERRATYADAGEIAGAQSIGGIIVEVDVDPTHPLAFGYVEGTIPVWRDHSIMLPPSANPYSTPFAVVEDEPRKSGFISEENHERIGGTASALTDGIGSGTVVLLLDNPNFRGYWYGTNRIFLNAIYFGDQISVPPAP